MPRRRYKKEASVLDDTSDQELQEIYFFGSLQSDPFTVTFRATAAEQARTVEILRERRKNGGTMRPEQAGRRE